MTTRIDLTFAHEYEVEILDELPGRAISRTYYYPPESKRGSIGLAVNVMPHVGDAWHGMILMDSDGAEAFVTSCPNPHEICLIAGPTGYIINVRNPGEATELPLAPITDVRPVLEDAVLVLADESTVGAWGRTGLAWRTPDLCWDDLRIRTIEDGIVQGEGWTPVEERMVSFSVRLADGSAKGGARPDDYSASSS